MPSKRHATRSQEEERKARNALASRKHYHKRKTEERLAKSKEKSANLKRSKRIDEDRRAHLIERARSLKRESIAGRKHINDLKSEVSELKAQYALLADAPEVDATQAAEAIAAYQRARKNAKQFQKLTNESPADFDELWHMVAPKVADLNYRGESRDRSASTRQQLPDEVQLFICLLFLRQYPTYALLSFALGGLSALSLHHYIFRVLVALSKVDVLAISWPTDAEMAEHVKKPQAWPYADKKDIVCATDGTEIRVGRPVKGAIKNTHYSAKKRQYALNVLLIVLLSGVIIYCSPPTDTMNDQAFFNKLGLRARFEGKPWGLIADSGFTLNTAKQIKQGTTIIGVTPHKQPRGRKKAKKTAEKQARADRKVLDTTDKLQELKGKVKRRRKKAEPNLVSEELLEAGVALAPKVQVPSLTDTQKRQNVELSRMRVVVENTNARLKIYKVLGSKLRHYKVGSKNEKKTGITPALIVQVVAGLTNMHIKKRPCRSIDWVPEKVTTSDLRSAEGSVCDSESESDLEFNE